MSVKPLLVSNLQREECVNVRRHRQQMWWAIGVALGVGVLSVSLNASLLYFRRLDSRAWNMTVNKAADIETARWQALFASQRENVARLSAIEREQSRMNEVVVDLTSRLPATTNAGIAAIPAKTIYDADFQGLLARQLFKSATDVEGRSDYERYMQERSIGANDEKTQARLRLLKTDAAIFSVLPKLGGDNWRAGLMTVPNGPDGVNAKGVQSSSHLIGVKGSLP